MTLPPFDRAAIESHVQLLHELAAATLFLILLPIREGETPRPQRFAIGNAAGMIESIMAFDGQPGVNLYAPYCTMFSDLRFGQAKVINGERGEKVCGDNQPIDRSRAEFVDERESGENRDRTSKPGEWCPPCPANSRLQALPHDGAVQ